MLHHRFTHAQQKKQSHKSSPRDRAAPSLARLINLLLVNAAARPPVAAGGGSIPLQKELNPTTAAKRKRYHAAGKTRLRCAGQRLTAAARIKESTTVIGSPLIAALSQGCSRSAAAACRCCCVPAAAAEDVLRDRSVKPLNVLHSHLCDLPLRWRGDGAPERCHDDETQRQGRNEAGESHLVLKEHLAKDRRHVL